MKKTVIAISIVAQLSSLLANAQSVNQRNEPPRKSINVTDITTTEVVLGTITAGVAGLATFSGISGLESYSEFRRLKAMTNGKVVELKEPLAISEIDFSTAKPGDLIVVEFAVYDVTKEQMMKTLKFEIDVASAELELLKTKLEIKERMTAQLGLTGYTYDDIFDEGTSERHTYHDIFHNDKVSASYIDDLTASIEQNRSQLAKIKSGEITPGPRIKMYNSPVGYNLAEAVADIDKLVKSNNGIVRSVSVVPAELTKDFKFRLEAFKTAGRGALSLSVFLGSIAGFMVYSLVTDDVLIRDDFGSDNQRIKDYDGKQ